MKRCTKCKVEKLPTDFHKKGLKYQAQCKECRRAQDKEQYETNPRRREQKLASIRKHKRDLREWYNTLKQGKPCADCGQTFHFAAMQWDHMPGQTKEGAIANMAARTSKQKVLDEIAKCELVCANCHAVRTYERAGEQVAA